MSRCSFGKKYDLVVIANEAARRAQDVLDGSQLSSNLLIEKPISESINQYKQIQQIYRKQDPQKHSWYISCPFVFSELVSQFLKKQNDPLNVYCIWNEENKYDPSYRLDMNITSTAVSHFLPILSAHFGLNYDSFVLESASENSAKLSITDPLFKAKFNISWARNNHNTKKE